jgi:hypothetical protein
MKTQQLKQFVLHQFELGTEFPNPAAWAKRLREEFPDAGDDEIITALCEIVDGYEPNRQKTNPKVVHSIFGENGILDFSAPNHRALTQMDSFLQNSDKYEKRWERAVRGLFRNDGGIGWEGVKKNDPDAFRQAWNEAVEWCEAAIANDGVTWEEIANA